MPVSQNILYGDGRVEGESSSYYDGIIDDVRIYDRELSADEIEDIYDNVVQ